MSEPEKVINIITVGDQTNNKSIFVELFDYHSRVKTFKWPIENELCRVNAIRQLQMNGEWLDNDQVKPGHVIACLNYELVELNTRYNVIDYSQRLNVRPGQIFKHYNGPQDTLNVVIMSVDCRRIPRDNDPRRSKEFEDVMLRAIPRNSAVIFIRDFCDQERERAFFRRELGCCNRENHHFVFSDLSFIDSKMAAEEAYNMNRAEFNRLIEFLDRLPPVSLEYVKNKMDLYTYRYVHFLEGLTTPTPEIATKPNVPPVSFEGVKNMVELEEPVGQNTPTPEIATKPNVPPVSLEDVKNLLELKEPVGQHTLTPEIATKPNVPPVSLENVKNMWELDEPIGQNTPTPEIATKPNLPPMSFEGVKNMMELDEPVGQNTPTPEIATKPKSALERYVRPVCVVAVATAVSLFLVCSYKKFFKRPPVPSFKTADKCIRSYYRVIAAKQKKLRFYSF